MPRGRFISRSFYDNYRLNTLSVECHHLFGGINVVCADREGRCKGQAKWINNQVFPLRNYTDKQVDGWLDELCEAKDDETGLGLIERYSVNSRSYIWIPGFDKHQKGRSKWKEAESEIPPPAAELMDKVRQGIVESRGEDEEKMKAEIKTDDLKVQGMIKSFEEQAGRILTPTDLKQLVDFADTYSEGWFEKALAEYPGKPLSYLGKVMEGRLEKEQPVESSPDNQGIESI